MRSKSMELTFRNTLPASLVALLLMPFLPATVVFAEAESSSYAISLEPMAPSTASLVRLNVDKLVGAACGAKLSGIRINSNIKLVDISLEPIGTTFTGCNEPDSYKYLLGQLNRAGTWVVRFYENFDFAGSPLFSASTRTAEFSVEVLDASALAFPETPANGSVQSGVGLVRGWACDAEQVHVQFDDGEIRDVGYGTSRTDTESVCGDSDNGYGLILAWGLLGSGQHTMKTYINGVEIREVTFEVSGLDDPFITGLSASYELTDFPNLGESVIVEWSEADQNFIIVEHAK